MAETKDNEEVICLKFRENGVDGLAWFWGDNGKTAAQECSAFIADHVLRHPDRADTTLHSIGELTKMSRDAALDKSKSSS